MTRYLQIHVKHKHNKRSFLVLFNISEKSKNNSRSILRDLKTLAKQTSLNLLYDAK